MEKNITWLQVNNWVPIISSAIMMTIAFGAVLTRLALIEQSQETILTQQSSMLELYKGVENRYGELALDVQTLKTLEGVE